MNTLHVTLSVASISIFLYGMRNLSSRKFNLFFFILSLTYSLLYLFYSVFYLVSYYFTGDGINHAVLYHVRYGLDGAGLFEYKALLLFVIVLFIVGILAGYFFFLKFNNNSARTLKGGFVLPLMLLLLSGCIHPATVDLYGLSSKKDGEPFWKYYKKPKIHNRVADKRNFIFIYAESLERTYFDQTIFPEIITSLRDIESKNISFTNIGNFPNTGWTIGGMVGSQCGLPLVSLSHGNSMAGMDTFLSGATCMGDLLSQQGYHLAYLGGSSLDFAGKGKFYQSHGFDEVLGREELTPLLPDQSYKSDWGLHDDSLFEIAFNKFEELSGTDNPYGLFLLTLDTHGSGQHYSSSCKEIVSSKGNNKALSTVSCADYLISDFIHQIQKSPHYRDTVIVIVSDHLAMRNSSYSLLKKGKRRNLFLIIDPRVEGGEVVDTKGSTLDIGATVLGALGFDAELGLGRNLLESESSLLTDLRHIDTTMSSWRDEITQFWSFPQISEKIIISEAKNSIEIDGRKFRTPVLIQYDEGLQTNMRFQIYNDAPQHKTLMEHLSELKADDPFLLVDHCKRLHQQWEDLKPRGLCYVNGKLGSSEMIAKNIRGEAVLKAHQLKSVAALPVKGDVLYNKRLEKLGASHAP